MTHCHCVLVMEHMLLFKNYCCIGHGVLVYICVYMCVCSFSMCKLLHSGFSFNSGSSFNTLYMLTVLIEF